MIRNLESRCYRQYAGRIVAYNDNQVDDLIEIRTGDETDSDADGAVDSVDVDDAPRAVTSAPGPYRSASAGVCVSPVCQSSAIEVPAR